MLRPLPAISPCPTSPDGRKVSPRRLKTDTGSIYPKSCPDHRLPLPLIAHSAAVTPYLRWIRGKLAKTDALDAAVLAHFAEAVRPPVRPLRDAETQVPNSLVARRHQVMTMLVSEKNRLSAAATVAVRPRIEAHIAWLERELEDLDEGLRRTLRQSPVWRVNLDLRVR